MKIKNDPKTTARAQVSQLFADHSDLLQEFTYFLPDAVQPQAKERLDRAARESAHRRISNRRMRRASRLTEGTDFHRDSVQSETVFGASATAASSAAPPADDTKPAATEV